MQEFVLLPELISQGVAALQEDMGKYPSFDPRAPYEEKNFYISRANNLCHSHLWGKHPAAVEVYYETMLNQIVNFERASFKRFNKGIVYANLGIAQILNGKFDFGISHLLAAEQEDRLVVEPDYTVLDTTLWQQFERPILFPMIKGLAESEATSPNMVIETDFLISLFHEMKMTDRIFALGTLWNLNTSILINDEVPNNYTKSRIYSGLKDLCLLCETLLRKRRLQIDDTASNQQFTLGKLLTLALPSELGYSAKDKNLWANNYAEFLCKFTYMRDKVTPAELSWISRLHLLRNFTGHHLEIGESVSPLNGKQSLDDFYRQALASIVLSLCFLKHMKAV